MEHRPRRSSATRTARVCPCCQDEQVTRLAGKRLRSPDSADLPLRGSVPRHPRPCKPAADAAAVEHLRISVPEPSTAPGSSVPEPSTAPGSSVPEPSTAPGSSVPEPSTAPGSSVPEPSTAPGSSVPEPSTAPGSSVPEPSTAPGSSVPEPPISKKRKRTGIIHPSQLLHAPLLHNALFLSPPLRWYVTMRPHDPQPHREEYRQIYQEVVESRRRFKTGRLRPYSLALGQRIKQALWERLNKPTFTSTVGEDGLTTVSVSYGSGTYAPLYDVDVSEEPKPKLPKLPKQ